MEFYVDPMASQPQQVVVNNKIKILRSDPNLDFRWAQEGCEKGDYWMGTRRMMGIGPDETTLQKNNRGWKIGSGTADNGIVDCRIRIVMVGDQDQDNGRLTIFDEIHNKTIWHSPRRQGREWGYTGVVYHPGMGLLLGSMENAWRIDLVSVTKIPKTKHKYLEFPATHLTVCESMLRPCFFSANQNSIRRFEGPDFKQTHFRYRFGRGAGPILALDEKRNHLYSSDYFFGDTEVLNSKTLNSLDLIDFPMGTRYLLYWKKKDVLIAANFFDGYLYSFQKEKGVRKLIFAGRKVRWVNLTRDENGLLWCAASACYEWRPKNIDLIN